MTEVLQDPAQPKSQPPTDPGGSDATLVAQAREANAQAFALLYRRHVQHTYNFAVLNVEDRDAAWDITQTIWLRALANLHQCREDDRFLGWLFAIARNVIADEHRSHKRVVLVYDDLATVEDTAESPESHAIRSDQHQTLQALRRRCLTAGEREILDLRLQELNDKQIADALGRSHGSIRNIQHRIVTKLRACFDALNRPDGGRHA